MENKNKETLFEGMNNYISLLRRDLIRARDEADNYLRKWQKSLKMQITLEKKIQKLEESNSRMKKTIEFIDKEKKELMK
jgi:hypothetical protein